MNNIDLKIKTKQMQNSNSKDGTNAATSTTDDATTSSQTIANPNVSGAFCPKCTSTNIKEFTHEYTCQYCGTIWAK